MSDYTIEDAKRELGEFPRKTATARSRYANLLAFIESLQADSQTFMTAWQNREADCMAYEAQVESLQAEVKRLTKQLAHWESGERDYADLLAEGRKMSLTLIDLTAERNTYRAMAEHLAVELYEERYEIWEHREQDIADILHTTREAVSDE